MCFSCQGKFWHEGSGEGRPGKAAAAAASVLLPEYSRSDVVQKMAVTHSTYEEGKPSSTTTITTTITIITSGRTSSLFMTRRFGGPRTWAVMDVCLAR
ncbi:hypothetical protein E2C01_000979 [Portunus trituberculatus]|uniref:Uncharacterized protein n=1 Tax=Portunus trituberculatus TaxID=210409 RepID=A0A5B7CLC7_PORTR|nr:hypothetical protein [Portunus trituberculatus]